MLQYAHDLTVESIAKKNFKYIDKILQSWSNAGITRLEQAKEARELFIEEMEKSGTKKVKNKNKNKLTKEELEGYLSLVNRFKED
ncbi:MAG: DnaD domain protein [Oscillospiraceae bacterium]|nr:DnaD domain protein [Oscillospiraceae bacterium]